MDREKLWMSANEIVQISNHVHSVTFFPPFGELLLSISFSIFMWNLVYVMCICFMSLQGFWYDSYYLTSAVNFLIDHVYMFYGTTYTQTVTKVLKMLVLIYLATIWHHTEEERICRISHHAIYKIEKFKRLAAIELMLLQSSQEYVWFFEALIVLLLLVLLCIWISSLCYLESLKGSTIINVWFFWLYATATDAKIRLFA